MSGTRGGAVPFPQHGGGGGGLRSTPVRPFHPSNLLQSLESCACDPVAVAVCFVTRVRGRGTGAGGGTRRGPCRALTVSSPPPHYSQSQEFDIYTQYCNNYPK